MSVRELLQLVLVPRICWLVRFSWLRCEGQECQGCRPWGRDLCRRQKAESGRRVLQLVRGGTWPVRFRIDGLCAGCYSIIVSKVFAAIAAEVPVLWSLMVIAATHTWATPCLLMEVSTDLVLFASEVLNALSD
jgi:hypothetical protein